MGTDVPSTPGDERIEHPLAENAHAPCHAQSERQRKHETTMGRTAESWHNVPHVGTDVPSTPGDERIEHPFPDFVVRHASTVGPRSPCDHSRTTPRGSIQWGRTYRAPLGTNVSSTPFLERAVTQPEVLVRVLLFPTPKTRCIVLCPPAIGWSLDVAVAPGHPMTTRTP